MGGGGGWYAWDSKLKDDTKSFNNSMRPGKRPSIPRKEDEGGTLWEFVWFCEKSLENRGRIGKRPGALKGHESQRDETTFYFCLGGGGSGLRKRVLKGVVWGEKHVLGSSKSL